MLKFLIGNVALMSGILLTIYRAPWLKTIPSRSVEIIFFLGITTAILYSLLFRRSRSASFTQAYLFSILLKMVLYAAFILVIIFSDRAGATANAVLFLAGYVLFTALEVGFLFKAVNR